MNRTAAILVVAGVLALVAAVLTGDRGTTTVPPVTPPTTNNGPVSINANLSGSHLLLGSSGEVFLDISIAADRSAVKAKRVPLNLALVVDRSGSMAGDKLTHAKDAARRLVQSLKDGDRLAVVTYGSDVTLLTRSTEITSITRRAILADIERIVDRGGTYLSGGFERGRDEVLRNSRAGHINRVILISDGQANEGLTSQVRLAQLASQGLTRGVHLTTMGVGLDFNENVMTAMAEHGGGHYYYIENSSSLASIFSKELNTLAATVARRAAVNITLEPGVQLKHLYGYTYQQSGRTVTVALPDVYGGEARKIMCKLQVPAGAAGARRVASVQLIYTDVDKGVERKVASSSNVVITNDSRAVTSGRNATVLSRAEQATISSTLNRAMELYSAGDVEQAQQAIGDQIAATAAANAELKDDRLDSILGRLKRKLKSTRAAAPSSARGKALIKGGKFDAYKMAK